MAFWDFKGQATIDKYVFLFIDLVVQNNIDYVITHPTYIRHITVGRRHKTSLKNDTMFSNMKYDTRGIGTFHRYFTSSCRSRGYKVMSHQTLDDRICLESSI